MLDNLALNTKTKVNTIALERNSLIVFNDCHFFALPNKEAIVSQRAFVTPAKIAEK